MKHSIKLLKRLFGALIVLTINGISPLMAQNPTDSISVDSHSIVTEIDPMDSVEVSLLTCSPHEEIYSLYGHTAIRWHHLNKQGLSAGEDWVFNWGMFNSNKPYFVIRFVFGLTDYELGAYPYSSFWPYYQKWGSSITEQVLNLTNDEKRRIEKVLDTNLRPENKVYRYNYFYDNCSTRPRDIIEANIDGDVLWEEREDYEPSYREMVHECVRNHPWAAFGNDMLLGIKADFKTTREQQEFLPLNLLYDFARAQIYSNGEYRPLVKEQRMAVSPGVQIIERDFIFSPIECAIMLLLLSFGIFFLEWRRKKTFKYWDVLLMTTQGLVGCLLFVMIFSQHPTTSLNLQILLLNPLPLFFIPAVIKRKARRWWTLEVVMIALFYVGAIWQHYAAGMEIVALCLLIRYWSNYRHAK